MFSDYIIKGIGGFYYVKTADGVLECKAKGIFRRKRITPVAGDKVKVQQEDGGNVIAEILPRKNVFVRPPVANVDNFFIVASTVQPVPSTMVIDKLAAVAADKGAEPILIITKTDLAAAGTLQKQYAVSGIPVIIADSQSSEGLQQIINRLDGKISVFCGNSGVGKSTLLSALAPQLTLQTGDISKKLGRGKHTTREVTLYEAHGGLVADTPGFASLDMERVCAIPANKLQYAFADIARYADDCRFRDCAHITEIGCAVRSAVQEGKISAERYQNYCALYQQAKEVKQW